MKKGRTFYSLLAFLTVVVLLCILFFSGFTVFADSNVDLKSTYNINSWLTSSDFPSFTDNGFVESSVDPWVDDLITDDLLTIPDNISNFGYGNPYYLMTYFTGQSCLFKTATDGSFLIVEDTKWGYDLYYDVTNIDTSNINFIDISSAIFGISGYSNSTSTSLNVNDIISFNNHRYYVIDSRSSSFLIAGTNLPIYSGTLGSVPVSLGEQLNPNYSGGSSSFEDASNNLYFEDPNFYFTNNSYTAPYGVGINTGDVYPNGYVDFTFNENDYQINNAAEFNLNFRFSFNLSINYKNWSQDFYVFKKTGNTNSLEKKTYSMTFTFNGQIDLDDYLELGYKKTFEYLFNNLKMSNGDSLTTFLRQVSELTSVEYNNFELYCTAFLTDDHDNKSGNYTEYYNPMKKIGATTDRSGENNTNPYYGNDSSNNTDLVPVDGAPGSAGNEGSYYPSNNTGMFNPYYGNSNSVSGGNSTSYGSSPSVNVSTGGVVVNNNRLVDPKPVVDYTKYEILPNENDTNYVGLLETVTHEDGFINLLSTTFSFVPVTVWNSLSHYFTIMLTMIVAFFALRLILDIL